MKTTSPIALVAALPALALATLPAAAQKHELRIGMVTINDAQQSFTERYAQEVAKATKGAVTVKVFPAGQLGSFPRQVENLKLGVQGGFIGPTGFLSGVHRGFQVTDAPGLFKSYWHAHNTVTDPEMRDKLINLVADKGIVGVALFNYGPQAIATRNPVKTLADLKGIKIRVLATKMESKVASVLGATGVPMPFVEVLPALQQRTIDGCRSSAAVMGASKFYTAVKNITMTQEGHIITGLWLSKVWLAKLPKDLQDILHKTGRDLEVWGGHNAAGFEERAAKLWKDNGATITVLSAADKAELTKRMAPLGDEFLGSDPLSKDLYATLKKVAARASDKAPKQQ